MPLKTLFGIPYQPGDLFHTIVEGFGGVHDYLGGQLPGFYDELGNTRRDMSSTELKIFNTWSTIAIPIAAPFAASSILSPNTWNAISALIK